MRFKLIYHALKQVKYYIKNILQPLIWGISKSSQTQAEENEWR